MNLTSKLMQELLVLRNMSTLYSKIKAINYVNPWGTNYSHSCRKLHHLFLLLFKACPWGTEAIYALNRWIIKWSSFSAKRALRNIEIRIFPNFLLQLLPISRLPFKYGVAKKFVRHLLAKEIEMAAAESMGLTFVDEDDLPVAFLRIAYVDSDNEAPSMSIAAMKR